MLLAKQLQKFLKKKFEQQKLTRKQFIQETGISASHLSRILDAQHPNPEFYTILKIADCFKCSLDEVTGRKKPSMLKKCNFVALSINEVNLNIKIFIEGKINKYNINKYELAKELGFNAHIISDFIKDFNRQKTLGTAVILALAEYFKIPSIDEMIGRVSLQSQEEKIE